jgi:2-C-methyl-D-erythritol 4-phosphate cytidylyltransferase
MLGRIGRDGWNKKMAKTAVLIVAAGKGERTGRQKPKQFEQVAGKSMLARSAAAFDAL